MRFYTKQHHFYCGIDLHANAMYVCILDSTGEAVVHKNIPMRPKSFLTGFRGKNIYLFFRGRPGLHGCKIRPVSDSSDDTNASLPTGRPVLVPCNTRLSFSSSSWCRKRVQSSTISGKVLSFTKRSVFCCLQ